MQSAGPRDASGALYETPGKRSLSEDPAYLAALASLSELSTACSDVPSSSAQPPPPHWQVGRASETSTTYNAPAAAHLCCDKPQLLGTSQGIGGSSGRTDLSTPTDSTKGKRDKARIRAKAPGPGSNGHPATTPLLPEVPPPPPPGQSQQTPANMARIGQSSICAQYSWPSAVPGGTLRLQEPGVSGVGPVQHPGSQQWYSSGGGLQQQANGAPPALYQEHWDQTQVQDGLRLGHLLRGRFRVNVSNKEEAYVTVPGLPYDCLLKRAVSHNRAIEGDEVALQLLPLNDWWTNHSSPATPAAVDPPPPLLAGRSGDGDASIGSRMRVLSSSILGSNREPWLAATSLDEAKAAVLSCLQGTKLRPTCKVVAILQPSTKRRSLVGVLQSTAGMMALLPLDPKMPACWVALASVRDMAEELRLEAQTSEVIARTLMSVQIVSWPATSPRPIVELRHSLGQAGQIETETAAILEMEGILDEPFGEDVLACLPPSGTPWSITAEDLAGRRDFRDKCVFSIDPPTAKDLDDALHIEPLPNGNFRVGVHIADVAHFVPPDSALDRAAELRSTSVYLVQRVIPMLPSLLCEELCSLNPGVERFAFSVEWELDPAGKVLSTWAGRSVIRSCAKLAYPMVQAMIEGQFDPTSCPAKLSREWSWPKIISDSLMLHGIALQLRAARFANGALRLDNVKLFYRMDKDGNPVDCSQYVQKEANALVEEFMLLANMTVANIISDTFPSLAMLRRHQFPNANKMKELEGMSAELGITLDASSAAALAKSLAELRATCTDRGMVDVVTLLATKPMQLAQYFCTGEVDDHAGWRHYALAVDAYTHFTSPIRRYPDVVVHRLLAAALEVREHGVPPAAAASAQGLFDTQRVGKTAGVKHGVVGKGKGASTVHVAGVFGSTVLWAAHCNDRRLSARGAQDASLKLYLCVMLRSRPLVADGIVSSVGGNKFFSVYLPDYGLDLRIQVDDIGVPLRAVWDMGSKTLVLSPGGGPAAMGSRGSSAGPRAMSAAPQGRCWLADLPPLGNPHGLRPMLLPLQVRLFSHVVVVIASPPHPDSGRPSDVTAHLLLDVPEVAAALAAGQSVAATAAAAAPATAASPAVGQSSSGCPPAVTVERVPTANVPDSFCIPYGSIVND